jgi:hypothetical protein
VQISRPLTGEFCKTVPYFIVCLFPAFRVFFLLSPLIHGKVNACDTNTKTEDGSPNPYTQHPYFTPVYKKAASSLMAGHNIYSLS